MKIARRANSKRKVTDIQISVEIAKKMLQKKENILEISEYTGLTIEEINSL